MGDSGNVKIYKTFDEKLKPLSPGAAWGIQYIKKRWIEGFTLEHWHELEEKWYREYLKVYEPHKLLKARKENIIKCFVEKNIPQAALEKLDALLSDFEMYVSIWMHIDLRLVANTMSLISFFALHP